MSGNFIISWWGYVKDYERLPSNHRFSVQHKSSHWFVLASDCRYRVPSGINSLEKRFRVCPPAKASYMRLHSADYPPMQDWKMRVTALYIYQDTMCCSYSGLTQSVVSNFIEHIHTSIVWAWNQVSWKRIKRGLAVCGDLARDKVTVVKIRQRCLSFCYCKHLLTCLQSGLWVCNHSSRQLLSYRDQIHTHWEIVPEQHENLYKKYALIYHIPN